MKGSIIFNGNIRFETEFIDKFRERILSSRHSDPNVRDSKKVLLITAAWRKREFHEGHIKKAIYQAGIMPKFVGGYDQNVQNLSIYHDFNRFKHDVPGIYAFYHSKQQVIQRVKQFYREKNSGLIAILQKQYNLLRETFRKIRLSDVFEYSVENNAGRLNSLNQWDLLYHYACQDIQSSMDKLRENDRMMYKICQEIDDYFFSNSNVMENQVYKKMKEELEKRILSSNSIFIFGGHIAVLYNRLNFFKLKDVFMEALSRGTNFYTVSAGSMSLCKNIIIFDSNSNEWNQESNFFDFEMFDFGFGLVEKIQIFPHCRDYINMKDPDTIAYTAERFKDTVCVGMDEESFLLMETFKENNQEYEKFTSVGQKEGLYIFKNTGKIEVKSLGEEINLPGTKNFKGI